MRRRTDRSRVKYYEDCWLAHYGRLESGDALPPCEGRLVHVHLIPRHVIRKAGGDPKDSRSWVWACGGRTGADGHHGMLDYTRTLRVARQDLPPQLVEFALQGGLLWYVERHYAQYVLSQSL